MLCDPDFCAARRALFKLPEFRLIVPFKIGFRIRLYFWLSVCYLVFIYLRLAVMVALAILWKTRRIAGFVLVFDNPIHGWIPFKMEVFIWVIQLCFCQFASNTARITCQSPQIVHVKCCIIVGIYLGIYLSIFNVTLLTKIPKLHLHKNTVFFSFLLFCKKYYLFHTFNYLNNNIVPLYIYITIFVLNNPWHYFLFVYLLKIKIQTAGQVPNSAKDVGSTKTKQKKI